MGRSKQRNKGKRGSKKHFLEDDSQMGIYNSIRKPKVRGAQVHTESHKKGRKFDWRDEIDSE